MVGSVGSVLVLRKKVSRLAFRETVLVGPVSVDVDPVRRCALTRLRCMMGGQLSSSSSAAVPSMEWWLTSPTTCRPSQRRGRNLDAGGRHWHRTAMNATATIQVNAPKDIKTLGAALETATALVVRCPAERFKAVATAIAKEPRPGLIDLELVTTDFEPDEEVGAPALTAKATDALWKALPSLQRLRLVGHALCRGIAHPGLERLEVEGYALGEGAVPPQGACPRLHTLRWAFSGDLYGVALEPIAIESLWTQALPALQHLDLCGADIDGSLLEVESFLLAPAMKRLKTLGLPGASTDGWREVLTALPNLISLMVPDPALAGLDQRIVVVEAASDDDDDTSDDEAAAVVDDVLDLNALDDKGLQKAKLLARVLPLRSLTLSHHDLEAPGARVVGQVLTAHPELETLDLNNPRSSGWDAEALAAFNDAVGLHPGLKALHFRNNDFEGAGKTIAALLGKFPHLEILELSQTDLGPGDLVDVLPAVSRLSRLKVLLMGNLKASEASAQSWKDLSSSTLQRLELWTSHFKEHWPVVFQEMGRRLPALEDIRLDVCNLPTAGTKAFAAAFRGHPHLRSLTLDVAPTSAAYDALGALFSSIPLTSLELEESKQAVIAGEDCASEGIGALRHAKGLTTLTIEIDREDTLKHQALAEALTTLPALRALSGWWPDEEDTTVLNGLEALLASSSIRTWKQLDRVTTEALLRRNVIEVLWIDASYNLGEILEVRAEGLQATTSLHTLVLFGGELKSDTAKILLKVLDGNTSIRSVTISMVTKVAVAKDLIKRISKIGRVETMSLALRLSAAEQAELVAAAKGNCKIEFVGWLKGEWH
jgi:hypothetical protein